MSTRLRGEGAFGIVTSNPFHCIMRKFLSFSVVVVALIAVGVVVNNSRGPLQGDVTDYPAPCDLMPYPQCTGGWCPAGKVCQKIAGLGAFEGDTCGCALPPPPPAHYCCKPIDSSNDFDPFCSTNKDCGSDFVATGPFYEDQCKEVCDAATSARMPCSESAPQCNGICPTEEECVTYMQYGKVSCSCEKIEKKCGDTSPQCNGKCDPGKTCVKLETAGQDPNDPAYVSCSCLSSAALQQLNLSSSENPFDKK